MPRAAAPIDAARDDRDAAPDVGQQDQHDAAKEGAAEHPRGAAAELGAGAVGEGADEGLDEHRREARDRRDDREVRLLGRGVQLVDLRGQQHRAGGHVAGEEGDRGEEHRPHALVARGAGHVVLTRRLEGAAGGPEPGGLVRRRDVGGGAGVHGGGLRVVATVTGMALRRAGRGRGGIGAARRRAIGGGPLVAVAHLRPAVTRVSGTCNMHGRTRSAATRGTFRIVSGSMWARVDQNRE